MTQNMTKRPRVAAIGLDEPQIESIAPLCGTLRPASSLEEYLKRYDWTETDITILGDGLDPVAVKGNVLTIGTSSVSWQDYFIKDPEYSHIETQDNTEREMRVSEDCPEKYRYLAAELARRLSNAEEPPLTVVSQICLFALIFQENALVETTSGQPVVLRSVVESSPSFIVLALPREVSLSAWFRAFLADIHELESGPSSAGPTPLRESIGLVHTQKRARWRNGLRKSQTKSSA